MHLHRKNFSRYLQLIRADRPAGTLLLLWPCLWALWLACSGTPELRLLIIFAAGAFVMRSAGCIANDLADRRVDPLVRRTRARPLATGAVSPREALELLALLLIVALVLVLFTNTKTLLLACLAVIIAVLYPFAKRFTHFPQAVLGIAFSLPVPMAWTAPTGHTTAATWYLFAGTFFWIMAYDTWYAMTDRDDDLLAGVKSTAVFFGRYDLHFIAICDAAAIILFVMTGILCGAGYLYYVAVVIMACMFLSQLRHGADRDPDACYRAFLSNSQAGSVLLMGILATF